jgi:hypothetical protein
MMWLLVMMRTEMIKREGWKSKREGRTIRDEARTGCSLHTDTLFSLLTMAGWWERCSLHARYLIKAKPHCQIFLSD